MSWTINKSDDDEVFKLADEYADLKENIARLQIRLESVRKELYSKMKSKEIATIENNIGRFSIFTRACGYKRDLNMEFKGLAYDEQDEIAKKGFLHRTYTLDSNKIAETNEKDYSHLHPYLIPYKTNDWVQFRFHTDVYNTFKEDDDL
ncbi:hypothetical protein EB155_08420 [archaeon]|nr:hypothetical protein [archaeon]NDB79878.1 hypothetical protein [archaeon]